MKRHTRHIRALATFGLSIGEGVRRRAALQRSCAALAARIVRASPVTTVVSGPSGSGKSTLLDSVRERAAACGDRVVRVAEEGAGCVVGDGGEDWSTRPIVAMPGTTMPEAMGLLARVGLADARLLGRTPGQLSAGERARFRLAMALRDAMEATERGETVWVLCDEFATGLDHETAVGVALNAARIARGRAGLRLVVCTSDERLVPVIGAALEVRTRAGRGPVVMRRRGEP